MTVGKLSRVAPCSNATSCTYTIVILQLRARRNRSEPQYFGKRSARLASLQVAYVRSERIRTLLLEKHGLLVLR